MHCLQHGVIIRLARHVDVVLARVVRFRVHPICQQHRDESAINVLQPPIRCGISVVNARRTYCFTLTLSMSLSGKVKWVMDFAEDILKLAVSECSVYFQQSPSPNLDNRHQHVGSNDEGTV